MSRVNEVRFHFCYQPFNRADLLSPSQHKDRKVMCCAFILTVRFASKEYTGIAYIIMSIFPLTRRIYRCACENLYVKKRPLQECIPFRPFLFFPPRPIMELSRFSEWRLGVREAIAKFCSIFPDDYGAEHDESGEYPTSYAIVPSQYTPPNTKYP